MKVFESSYNKNSNQFVTLTGMAMGLSAQGDYKKALEYASKPNAVATNDNNRKAAQVMIDKLKAGKDIN